MANHVTNKRKPFQLPKGLKISLGSSRDRAGIHWVGRNEDGISMWEGSWRGFPKWFTRLFKCLGIGLLCLAATFASIRLWPAVPGPAIAGTVHTILGFVVFERLKYRFDSSMTSEEAANQLGFTPEEFEEFVEEKDIRPTHYFNGEPIYNLDSLGDVGVLLRAADRPTGGDHNLLRAARGVSQESVNNLLRPAGNDEAPVPALSTLPDSEQSDCQSVEQRAG